MTKRKCKRKNKKAFTLIELLVVIAIIGILSVLVIAAVGMARERAHVAQMKSSVTQVKDMIEMYLEKNGSAPSSLTWSTAGQVSDLTDSSGQDYGRLPENGTNHITYTYQNQDGDDSTFLIQGTHTSGGTTDSFYCNSKTCNVGIGTEE